MKKQLKILLICAFVLFGVIRALTDAFVESILAKNIANLICAPLAIAICIVFCVDAVKQVNKTEQNDDLTERQKKWKKTEIITITIVVVLLCVNSVLSAVREITNFNSTASSVLSGIYCVLTFSDLIILIISWCKLYRLNSLIEKKTKNTTQIMTIKCRTKILKKINFNLSYSANYKFRFMSA